MYSSAQPPGLLAYLDGEAMGWCRVGPERGSLGSRPHRGWRRSTGYLPMFLAAGNDVVKAPAGARSSGGG